VAGVSPLLRSPAKINLSLKVFERLASGYHRVETAMIKVDLADDIRVESGPGDGVSVLVPGFPDLENERNLAARAAEAYLEAAGVRREVRIRVEKRIPIGGGLGGGSSNAAAVLSALQEELGRLSPEILHSIATKLGADVPFFLYPPSLGFAKGIGEELSFWKAPPSRPVLLVNPGFPISTAEAYQALSRTLTWKHPNGSSFAPRSGPENWRDLGRLLSLGNDLQEVVEARHPEIAAIRNRLSQAGASFSQMSGSGSTVFGLFDRDEDADQAVCKLDPKWKAFVTRTRE
jgi:4-diphosphocytidyl-2-C-methyl-D-erythritol kinase